MVNVVQYVPEAGKSALLVVDIQERLAAAMPAEPLARTVKNARILIEGARALGVPVLVIE